jgi:hypothetical protein
VPIEFQKINVSRLFSSKYVFLVPKKREYDLMLNACSNKKIAGVTGFFGVVKG